MSAPALEERSFRPSDEKIAPRKAREGNTLPRPVLCNGRRVVFHCLAFFIVHRAAAYYTRSIWRKTA